MALSVSSTLLSLKNDPRAREILARHLPGIWEHPQIKLALGMPLKVIAAMPQAAAAGIKPEMIKAIEEELKALV
jgi:hypothetical protein